jgi:hypothetical protein
MGEAGKDALWGGSDLAVRLECHGARVSSDAGLFPYRKLDEAAGLTTTMAGGAQTAHRPVLWLLLFRKPLEPWEGALHWGTKNVAA